MKEKPGSTKELFLARLCARINPDQKSLNQIKDLLAADLNWDLVLETGLREGILPLLYRNLKKFHGLLAENNLNRLKHAYIQNVSRNLYLYSRIKPLIISVKNKAVKLVMIKGGRLAVDVYEDIGLRPFLDIDLLVSSPDRKKMVNILDDLGFFRYMTQEALSQTKKKDEDYWTFRPEYIKGDLPVELHYNFPGLLGKLNSEELMWKERQFIDFEETMLPVLSLEYELCLLSMHAAQHSYSRLSWITDIAEISSKKNLNWDKVLSICELEKISAVVFHSLKIVQSLWPKTISSTTLDRFRIKTYESFFLKLFWPVKKIVSRERIVFLPMYTPTVFALIGRKNFSLLIKTVLKFYFPPRAWVVHYYNISPKSIKIYFHYLWRFFHPILVVSRRILRLD